MRPPGRESRPAADCGTALEINAGQAVDTFTILHPDEVVGARIVLAELKPLYLVEAGQLQPVLPERVAS